MPDKWDQLMRKFQDEEKERVKKVIEEYESKYAKKMEDLMEENRLLVKELNQIHVCFIFIIFLDIACFYLAIKFFKIIWYFSEKVKL